MKPGMAKRHQKCLFQGTPARRLRSDIGEMELHVVKDNHAMMVKEKDVQMNDVIATNVETQKTSAHAHEMGATPKKIMTTRRSNLHEEVKEHNISRLQAKEKPALESRHTELSVKKMGRTTVLRLCAKKCSHKSILLGLNEAQERGSLQKTFLTRAAMIQLIISLQRRNPATISQKLPG